MDLNRVASLYFFSLFVPSHFDVGQLSIRKALEASKTTATLGLYHRCQEQGLKTCSSDWERQIPKFDQRRPDLIKLRTERRRGAEFVYKAPFGSFECVHSVKVVSAKSISQFVQY